MKKQKVTVYCKTIAKGVQAYYLSVNDRDYYLFAQNYRKSNREFFGMGVLLKDALDFSASHSTSVRKTMTKLIPHIKYIEKEHGLTVLRTTQKSKSAKKNDRAYNRQKFKANSNEFYVA